MHATQLKLRSALATLEPGLRQRKQISLLGLFPMTPGVEEVLDHFIRVEVAEAAAEHRLVAAVSDRDGEFDEVAADLRLTAAVLEVPLGSLFGLDKNQLARTFTRAAGICRQRGRDLDSVLLGRLLQLQALLNSPATSHRNGDILSSKEVTTDGSTAGNHPRRIQCDERCGATALRLEGDIDVESAIARIPG